MHHRRASGDDREAEPLAAGWAHSVAEIVIAVTAPSLTVDEVRELSSELGASPAVLEEAGVLVSTTGDHDLTPAQQAAAVYQRSASPVRPRTHAELTDMLAGFDLVSPGLVDATDWHPSGATHPASTSGSTSSSPTVRAPRRRS